MFPPLQCWTPFLLTGDPSPTAQGWDPERHFTLLRGPTPLQRVGASSGSF